MKDIFKIILILVGGIALSSAPLLPANPTTTNMLAQLARKKANAGGGGTSPGTTNLVAWYDFDDSGGTGGETDSHSTYDLTENSSTYQSASSPEYGIAADTGSYWTQASLDNDWHADGTDCGFVLRFQGYGDIADGDIFFACDSTRVHIRWNTASIEVRIGVLIVTVPVAPSTGTWYTVVATMDWAAGDDTATVWVNGGDETSTTGSGSSTTGDAYFGSNRFGTAQDVYIDFAGFYDELLTQDNATWFYNSGSTRVYGDL